MSVQLDPILTSFQELNVAFRRLLQTSAEAQGVSAIQLLMLRLLSHRDNLSVSEAADALQMSCSAISVTVEQLVKRGWVDRVRLQRDRRTVKLNLTPTGREKTAALLNPDSGLIRRISPILELPEEELQQMLAIHQKILRKLKNEEENHIL